MSAPSAAFSSSSRSTRSMKDFRCSFAKPDLAIVVPVLVRGAEIRAFRFAFKAKTLPPSPGGRVKKSAGFLGKGVSVETVPLPENAPRFRPSLKGRVDSFAVGLLRGAESGLLRRSGFSLIAFLSFPRQAGVDGLP